jgi:hypothetical protein
MDILVYMLKGQWYDVFNHSNLSKLEKTVIPNIFDYDYDFIY